MLSSRRGISGNHAALILFAVGLIFAARPAHAVSGHTLLTLTGQAAGDRFGYSVETAGDFNGDGHADVIVGAVGNDAGGTNAGRAYLYFGGPGADTAADLILTGAAGEAFGAQAGTGGDFNGDGRTDVIVGAPFSNAGGDSAGRAYVYFGGPGADATADMTLTGTTAGEYLGLSVGIAGDFNGDGYADVIVGAPFGTGNSVSPGKAFIYFGGPGADNNPDLTLTGSSVGNQFGFAVGTAGDVNGDGYADVIVGAVGDLGAGTDPGWAYIFYGGPGADAIPDLILTGEAAGDDFGISVGTAGDVNGDGYADVIVGAMLNSAGSIEAGRAYVYYGGPAADAIPDLIFTGAAQGDRLGHSAETAGDINGDGYSDVIVGSYHNDTAGTDAGQATVYYGGPGADATPDLILNGAAARDVFGFSVGTAGDFDGDGTPDLIIGAQFSDAGGVDAGRAYVVKVDPSVVVFDSFDPGGGFHPQNNLVAADAYADIFPPLFSTRAAAQFTVSGGSFDLSYVTLPISVQGYPSGINDDVLRVRLTEDAAGAPGVTMEVLSADQSIWPTFSNPFTTTTTLSSTLHPTLHDGSKYWVVTELTTLPSISPPYDIDYRWFENATGIGVPSRQQQQSGALPSDPWTGFSGDISLAFRVEGTPHTAADVVMTPPTLTALAPARPTPFRGHTTLEYSLTRGGAVELAIFGVDGRRIRTLERGTRNPGVHRVEGDGRDDHGQEVSAGIYFSTLDTAEGRSHRTLVRLK